MTLQMDEQKLLADFRKLTPDAQNELLDYINFLAKKQRSTIESERAGTGSQCALKQQERRPETA